LQAEELSKQTKKRTKYTARVTAGWREWNKRKGFTTTSADGSFNRTFQYSALPGGLFAPKVLTQDAPPRPSSRAVAQFAKTVRVGTAALGCPSRAK